VLHYLGLDHIGHLDGPRSLLVQPKLSEMDGIVQHVVNTLYQQVSASDVLYFMLHVIILYHYVMLQHFLQSFAAVG